jgi:large subunit ribosomal protein L15
MPHKLRKIRKTRGSRTQGFGRIGQHRDSGSKGYRKVGRHKHLWSYVVTHEPDYFGKSGFTSPKSLKTHDYTINIQKLTEMTPTQKDGKNIIDLTSLGYTKLLGTGRISKAIVVTVPSVSKMAQEKILEAGGEVIVPQVNGE